MLLFYERLVLGLIFIKMKQTFNLAYNYFCEQITNNIHWIVNKIK